MSLLTLLGNVRALLRADSTALGVVSERDPVLAPLVDAVLPHCNNRDEAHAFVAIHAQIVDLPGVSELRTWMAALQPPLQILLSHTYRRLHAPAGLIATTVALEQVLAQHLQAVRPHLPSPVEDFPLAAFIGAFNPTVMSGSAPNISVQFRDYGLDLFLSLRAMERHMSLWFTPRTLRRNQYDYGVALRYSVPFFPLAATWPFTAQQIDAICDAMKNDAAIGDLEPSTKEAFEYRVRQLLTRRFTIQPGHPTSPYITHHGSAGRLRPTLAVNRVRSSQWLNEISQPTGISSPGAETLVRIPIVVSRPADVVTAGESLYEHAVELVVDDKPEGDPYRTLLRLRHANAAQAREVVGAVCATPIRAHDLLRLIERLAWRAQVQTGVHWDLALALLLDYFIPVARLWTAEWGQATETSPPGQIWLDPDGVISYRLGTDEMGYQDQPLPGDKALYRPGSAVIRLPLSEGVRRLAQMVANDKGNRGLIFDEHNRAGLEAFVHRQLGQSVSLAMLRRSAVQWAKAAGLERIYAALLSGDYSIVEKATIFYVNVDPVQVARAQELALLRRVRLGCREPSLNIAAFYTPCHGELPRCGSRIVPLEDRVRDFFQAVRTILAGLSSPSSTAMRIRAHNLHLLYTYLVYLWATAVRPFEGGVPDRNDVIQDGDGPMWVRVMDKSNRTRTEARVLPFPDTMARLLVSHRDGSIDTLRMLRALGKIDYDDVDEATLFVVIDQGKARPLREPAAQLQPILCLEGLDALYPFPLNVPRHFWITWALENGYSLDVLEPHLGHQHPGQEALAWYALQSHSRSTVCYREVGTAILSLLNINPIPYPGLKTP